MRIVCKQERNHSPAECLVDSRYTADQADQKDKSHAFVSWNRQRTRIITAPLYLKTGNSKYDSSWDHEAERPQEEKQVRGEQSTEDISEVIEDVEHIANMEVMISDDTKDHVVSADIEDRCKKPGKNTADKRYRYDSGCYNRRQDRRCKDSSVILPEHDPRFTF